MNRICSQVESWSWRFRSLSLWSYVERIGYILFSNSLLIKQKERKLIVNFLSFGVADGTRTHDIQNHNLTL